MPTVRLSRNIQSEAQSLRNPLPSLLRTPLGLAIIEIQGTIHAPGGDKIDGTDGEDSGFQAIDVGQFEFPLYDGGNEEGSWMKRVYLYIGKHQRLTGEVKKLAKPLVVLSKDDVQQNGMTDRESGISQMVDQLSIDAVVKYKILFSNRPEPVGK